MRIAAHVHWARLAAGVEAAPSLALSSPVAGGAAADGAGVAGHGHIRLVADARIDNLSELRRALGAGPDDDAPAVLVRGYLTWGDSLADRIVGDFAIVIWDAHKRRLLALRDPFGVRPLVYRSDGQQLWVASRVEQILSTFDGRPALDDRRVVEHLLWRHHLSDATFFRDVRQVPPGHLLAATTSGLELRRTWGPPPRMAEDRTSPEDYQAEFKRLFLVAVERRLRSPKPVLVHASGGLDSSAVAGAAAVFRDAGSLPNPGVIAVAAEYPGLACDERTFIDAVARRVRFPFERWDGTRADPIDLVAPTIESPGGRVSTIDGTMGDVEIAQAHGAEVILSGNGGDQLTGVSGIVKDMLANGELGRALREILFFPGARMRTRLGRLRYVLEDSLPNGVRQVVARTSAVVPDWLAHDLRPWARESAVLPTPTVEFASHVQRHRWEALTSQQVARAVEGLQREVGYTNIEFRFPYLDRELVDFTLAIPYTFWPRPTRFARFHREALKDLLPDEVATRVGKAEFTPALMNRVLRAQAVIQDLLEGDTWASARYVDRNLARRLWYTITLQRDVRAWLGWRFVWAIAALEAWLRAVFRYHSPA